MTKDELMTKLRNGPCLVKFNKIDGEYREMNCTLNEDLIPSTPNQTNNITQTRKENPAVQSVWDLDKKAWRSFRWENLINE